ncbi:MAG: hypothetical protein ACLFV5_07575 [Anaerolineales bacterium]
MSWEHAITIHTRDEIVEAGENLKAGEEIVLFCDTEGDCFFDDAPNPYLWAMTEVLDRQGADGWVLVDVTLRERDMICFWRRERASEA